MGAGAHNAQMHGASRTGGAFGEDDGSHRQFPIQTHDLIDEFQNPKGPPTIFKLSRLSAGRHARHRRSCLQSSGIAVLIHKGIMFNLASIGCIDISNTWKGSGAEAGNSKE